ncbi:hypothetical protein LXL04_007997 [Taraxacum kok-saghyz]
MMPQVSNDFDCGYSIHSKESSRVKTSAVCGPHLQSSVEEEVVQTSAVCSKKTRTKVVERTSGGGLKRRRAEAQVSSGLEQALNRKEQRRRKKKGRGVGHRRVAQGGGAGDFGSGEVVRSGEKRWNGRVEMVAVTSAGNVFPPADLEPCLPARRRVVCDNRQNCSPKVKLVLGTVNTNFQQNI